MIRYLIVSQGTVIHVLDKEAPLLGSDIDGYFDTVLIDIDRSYQPGDRIELSEVAARNEVPRGGIGHLIDMGRYMG